MARDIYYQAVGNPLQSERLPKRRPDLQLPLFPSISGEEPAHALKVLLMFCFLAAATALSAWMQICADHAAADPISIWGHVIPGSVGLYLFATAWRQKSTRPLQLPLLGLVAAVIYLKLPVPIPVQLVLLAGCLTLFTWVFSLHWISHCTASPMDRKTATRLKRQWCGYLAFMSLAPPAMLILGFIAPISLTICLLLAIVLFQLVESRLGQRARRPTRAAWRALVSWLTYNRQQADTPGTFRSPAGHWSQRMALSAACIFLVAVTLLRWPIESALASSLPIRDVVAAGVDPQVTAPDAFQATSMTVVLLRVSCLMIGLVSPVALPFATALLLTLPVLVSADARRKTDVTPLDWKHLVDEVRTSVDPIERKSLYMGQIAHDGSPLLVPRELFHEHGHFLGDSGAGKTSMGLAPLLEQIISRGDCSVVVIDLKADSMELLGTLATAARAVRKRTGRKIPLKHFSNQVGRSSFAFNPLLQPYWRNLELYMRTDIQCGALGLTYGADYGEGYYSSANAAVLYHTIKTFPDVVTYRDLARQIGYVVANAKRSELHPEIRKAGVHVQTILNRLGSFDALNVTPESGQPREVLDASIDFSKVFAEPQVHYFHLSSTLGPGSSPEIARLATYSLLAAATQVERRHQVFLVIDEFQRMVARNIEYMLQLARSMGVGVVLANQTMQDLRTSTADLIPAIEANCRYRQWFAVSSAEDRQRLSEASGETVDLEVTRTHSSGSNGPTTSVSYHERVVPRLSVNDILLASDHPRQSIARISRGAGYAQYGGLPFVVESNYHITEDEYESRKATAWPDGARGSFFPGQSCVQPSRPAAGPTVTTEIIGASASPSDQAADLFNSFLQSTSQQPKPRQQRRRKNK